MTTAQAISQRVAALPEPAQREVLHFVEFLHARAEAASREGDAAWSEFSLASAMRGMEDEPSPYTAADLKASQ